MISASELREILDYCPETGVFRWKQTRNSRALKGAKAGCDKGNGYWSIGINGRYHKSHRLAWLYVYGAAPEGIIDHINGDPSDNRIANLRLATASQNRQNSAVRSDSISGAKGVKPVGNRWKAHIRAGGEMVTLGYFDTVEEAAEAYRVAALKEFGSFSQPASRSRQAQAGEFRAEAHNSLA